MTPDTLEEPEKKELYNLGKILAHMTWLRLVSDDPYFALGVSAAGGVVAKTKTGNTDDYKGIVYYRMPVLAPESKVVYLPTLERLKALVAITATELYRRGIIR